MRFRTLGLHLLPSSLLLLLLLCDFSVLFLLSMPIDMTTLCNFSLPPSSDWLAIPLVPVLKHSLNLDTLFSYNRGQLRRIDQETNTFLAINATEQAKQRNTIVQGHIVCIGSSSPVNVPAASEDIHFKRDDDLELTRCAWLQLDHAHVCVWVVKVAAS